MIFIIFNIFVMLQENYPELAELSQLKKQLITVKVDLQKQSYELQAERQLNIQLTSLNQQLHQKLKQSNNKLLLLQQRLNAMSDNYETQIEQLKILVDSRSEELQELSRQLLPKVDEDMLRIRLLNEIEIPHREELDEKESQLARIQQQILHVQKDNEVLQAKIEHLQELKEKELNELKREHTNNILIYKTEIQMLSEQNIKGLDYSRKLRKQIDELRHKQNHLKQKHMSEIEELNKENNKIIMNYGSDHQLRSLRFEIDQKNNQLRQQKEEILRVRKQLDNSRQQYTRLQIDCDQLRSENNNLKQSVDSYQVANLQLKLAAEPLDNYQANIRALRKEIGLKNDQIVMLLEKIKNLEDSKARDKTKEKIKAKIERAPEEEDQKTREIDRLRQDIQVLSANLRNKQLQYEDLSSQVQRRQRYPKKQVRFDDRTRGNFRQRFPSRSPDRNLKQKLKQANSKIVELLRQKAYLKQQIIRLTKK